MYQQINRKLLQFNSEPFQLSCTRTCRLLYTQLLCGCKL